MLNRFLFFIPFMVSGLIIAQETSEAFRKMDRNKDNKLTKEEFMGPPPLFAKIDTNKDGIITAEEDIAFARGGPKTKNPKLSDSIKAEKDIPYAETDNPRQRLDLYLPKNPKSEKPLPVVVFIHGGGWQNGDKSSGLGTVGPLVESGEYAGVSIGYRLTGEAMWPAQIYDCKAAIRWIRGNAKKYNFDPENIGVAGSSAGGHLVAMLGTSGDVEALEGKLGKHLLMSSRVTCVVNLFGPSDLLTMGGSHNSPGSPEAKLIGGALQENPEKAKLASPITYVTKDDPPFLFIHGTSDPVVAFSQSESLNQALKKVGVTTFFVPVTNGGHGNFGTPEPATRLRQFFDKYLLGKEVMISIEAIQSIEGKRPKL
jgi:acetyl esterase/lipase